MILPDCCWFHFWLPILRSYLRVFFDGTSSPEVWILKKKKHACVLWALLDMCILSFEAAVEGLRLFMRLKYDKSEARTNKEQEKSEDKDVILCT